MERVRVHLSGPDRRALRRAVRAVGADLCFGSGRDTEAGFTIDGVLLAGQIEAATESLARAGVRLTVIGPVERAPSAVATGDRFARLSALPRGLGAKE